ncbi:MAG: hypothetical protein ACM34M_15580 [Ignavibacteria bacterium]
MKIIFLSFELFLFSPLFFSQSSEIVITSQSSGYQVTSLSGYGFENNNLTTVSNFSNSNPALMTEMPSFSFGISKQFNSDINGSYDITYSQALNWIPQSAGLLVSFGEFRLGAGMSQLYNSAIDLEPIPVTTIDQPDGTGEYFDFTSKTSIITSSLLAAYPLHNLFSSDDLLSLGAQLNLNFIHHKESLWKVLIKSDSHELSGKIGFNYKFSETLPLTQLSAFYEKGFKNQNPWTAEDRAPDRVGIDSGRISALIPITFSLTSYVPDKLSLGILFQTTEKFIITGNISNIFWNSYQQNIHNQIEFSSSFIYKWENFITTSAGIYLTNRDYITEYTYNEGSAVFLSLGTIINLSGFNIEAVLADSHLFSEELRKQTLIKIGLNIFT